jgi:hypothetical protein
MSKKLVIEAGLIVGLLTISGSVLAQNTNPVSINNAGWTNVGVGPLSVSALGPEWPGVSLVQSATSSCAGLSTSIQGEPLRDRRFFGEATAVCAKSAAAVASVIVTTPDFGSSTGNVSNKDAQLAPLGVYQVSIGATAQSLAALIGASIPSGARVVYIEPEGGDIRFRDDGTAPTASVGLRIYNGVAWPYIGNLSAQQLIAVTGSVTVNLAFYQ